VEPGPSANFGPWMAMEEVDGAGKPASKNDLREKRIAALKAAKEVLDTVKTDWEYVSPPEPADAATSVENGHTEELPSKSMETVSISEESTGRMSLEEPQRWKYSNENQPNPPNTLLARDSEDSDTGSNTLTANSENPTSPTSASDPYRFHGPEEVG